MPDWTSLAERWERMKWAREHARFATAKDAADRLAIPEPTYRTYERDSNRWPKTAQIQRIAKTFKISWTWLETGSGDPFAGVAPDEDVERLIEAARVVDLEKRQDAINAAVSVLNTFRKRA